MENVNNPLGFKSLQIARDAFFLWKEQIESDYHEELSILAWLEENPDKTTPQKFEKRRQKVARFAEFINASELMHDEFLKTIEKLQTLIESQKNVMENLLQPEKDNSAEKYDRPLPRRFPDGAPLCVFISETLARIAVNRGETELAKQYVTHSILAAQNG